MRTIPPSAQRDIHAAELDSNLKKAILAAIEKAAATPAPETFSGLMGVLRRASGIIGPIARAAGVVASIKSAVSSFSA